MSHTMLPKRLQANAKGTVAAWGALIQATPDEDSFQFNGRVDVPNCNTFVLQQGELR